MTVITFPPKVPRDGNPWPADELKEISEALAPHLSSGEAGGWDVGATEIGDPQFYLLGPPPKNECVLCISRLGRLYVLEDSAGQVSVRAQQPGRAGRAGAQRAAEGAGADRCPRHAVLVCGARAFEEKIEPIVGESEELLTHFVPQLAAFA